MLRLLRVRAGAAAEAVVLSLRLREEVVPLEAAALRLALPVVVAVLRVRDVAVVALSSLLRRLAARAPWLALLPLLLRAAVVPDSLERVRRGAGVRDSCVVVADWLRLSACRLRRGREAAVPVSRVLRRRFPPPADSSARSSCRA